jgi:uncharacterized protein YegL
MCFSKKRSGIILAGLVLLLGGCAPVIEKIQSSTGSNLNKIDQVVQVDSNPAPDSSHTSTRPLPVSNINDILQYKQMGKYAGDKYNEEQVLHSLQLMPKGLSERDTFLYLFGLVGEAYYKDILRYESLYVPNYQARIALLKAIASLPVQPPASQKPNQPGAQPTVPAVKPANVFVLLDLSSSMNQLWDSQRKIDWVKTSLERFVTQLPNQSTVYLQVYGHKGDKVLSCQAAETVYVSPKSNFQAGQFYSKIAGLKPSMEEQGRTPLALALTNVENELKKSASAVRGENVVFIVTDGADNCGGNPAAVAQKLAQSNYKVSIHVITVKMNQDKAKQLVEIAEKTGGNYHAVSNTNELAGVFQYYINDLANASQPWQIRALDAVTQSYILADQQLNEHYKAVKDKIDQEYQRLSDANNYIYENEKKIDGKEWQKINGWIEQRRDTIGQYNEQLWQKKHEELYQNYLKEVQALEKEWKKPPDAKQDAFELRKKALQKQLELQLNLEKVSEIISD